MKCISKVVTVSFMLVACSDATGIHPDAEMPFRAAVMPGDQVYILVVAGEHEIQPGTDRATVTVGRTIGAHTVGECTGDALEYPIQGATVHDPKPTPPSPTPGGAHRITMTVATTVGPPEPLKPGTKLGNLRPPFPCTVGNTTYDVFLATVF